MKGLLLLKHWHLFVLIVILGAFAAPGYVPVVPRLIALLAFIGWLSAIAIYGNKKINDYGLQPLNEKLFRFNSFVVLSTIITMLFFLLPGKPEAFTFADMLLVVWAAYFIYAVFYCLFFIARVLSIVIDKNRGGDYLGRFFLVFFFPVGVWILQPKINRIFSSAADGE
ncbi:MAG: hypothetical protein JST81_12020 [Bacteroidetes bacterium]|nr:hypothetical protein [Bacteroidota bacterium]